jgi:hypothetical protein
MAGNVKILVVSRDFVRNSESIACLRMLAFLVMCPDLEVLPMRHARPFKT